MDGVQGEYGWRMGVQGEYRQRMKGNMDGG